MSKKLNRYEVKYDMLFVNFISFVYMFIVFVVVSFIYNNKFLSSRFGDFSFSFENAGEISFYMLLFFFLFILWAVLHEIIHAISYIVMGANKNNISFGVVLEKGIFFCKCGEDIDKKNIMMSVMAPFFWIGIVTGIISILIGSHLLLFLSAFNIIGASGDLTMFFFFIKRNKDIKFREVGDSTTFILTTSEDLTNRKFLGIKSIKLIDKDEYNEKENNKFINITKFSKGFILIYLIMMLISTFMMFFS